LNIINVTTHFTSKIVPQALYIQHPLRCSLGKNQR
jgi:hypothetical protein